MLNPPFEAMAKNPERGDESEVTRDEQEHRDFSFATRL